MALRMMAPNLPVILTSGYHEQDSARNFVTRGLADFLPKPFVAHDLVTGVSTVISRGAH